MNLGRSWVFHCSFSVANIFKELPTIPEGSVYMQGRLARALGVEEGDTVYLDFLVSDFFGSMWSQIMGHYDATYGNDSIPVSTKHLYHPVKIATTFGSPSGKFSNSISNAILMDYKSFLSYTLPYFSPFIPTESMTKLSNANIYQISQQLLINLPPPRVEAYLSR